MLKLYASQHFASDIKSELKLLTIAFGHANGDRLTGRTARDQFIGKFDGALDLQIILFQIEFLP
ncbi:MAG: hypothetical protein VYB59_03755, partial [Pseudomonadota bacterium]|nr:hypothetical protein [Pseudomonadota bacterium]